MSVSDVSNMADRAKSEFGKAVKNPLLSGAGAGFPFENFPGSSLILPVPKESPPVLLDDVGEVDTFIGQDKPITDNIGLPVPQAQPPAEPLVQRYSGLFSSFFGSSQVQPEEPVLPPKPVENQSVGSTPRSYSPYIHVPSAQSYSPALSVPLEPPPVGGQELKQPLEPPPPSGFQVASLNPPPQSTLQTDQAQQQQFLFVPSLPVSATQTQSYTENKPPYSNPVTGQFEPTLQPPPSGAPSTSAPSYSSSSSSDSIVADLQNKFGSTSNSENVPEASSKISTNSSEVEAHEHEQSAKHLEHNFVPPATFGLIASGRHPESSATDFFGFGPTAETDYGTKSPLEHSFGAIGQPYHTIPGVPIQTYNPSQFFSASNPGFSPQPSVANKGLSAPSHSQPSTTQPPVSSFQSNTPGQWQPFSPNTGVPYSLPVSSPQSQSVPNVPQQPLPPPVCAPVSKTASGVPTKSYRLGSQRRLAYAPVPGLASSPPSQNIPPPVGQNSNLSTISSSKPHTLFNPAATYLTSGQTTTPPLLVPSSTPSLSSPSQLCEQSSQLGNQSSNELVTPPSNNFSLASTAPIASVASTDFSSASSTVSPPPFFTPFTNQQPPSDSSVFAPTSTSTSTFSISPQQPPEIKPLPPFNTSTSTSTTTFSISPQQPPEINPPPPFSTYSPVEPIATIPSKTTQLFQPITEKEASSFFNSFATPTDPPPTTMAAKDDPGTLNTVDLSTPQLPQRSPSPSVVPPKLLNLGQSGIIYRPPYYHWFWNKDVEGKEDWQPFSMTDSFELEQAYNSEALTMDTVVATDGGRYDVQVVARRRDAVYWQEPSCDVRRCSWYDHTKGVHIPYDENTACILEEDYKTAVMTSTWNRQVLLNDGSYVHLYGPTTMVHVVPGTPTPDAWEASTDLGQSNKKLTRVVKRGVNDLDIDEGEPADVDHLLFVVHGVGGVCDLKFRTIEEAVRDFRSKSHHLIQTHFRTAVDRGEISRVEILPVSWHHNLHGETGVDEKLKKITLKSIPKLRHFTNDTLLDILFYTSPVYCQNIVQQVGQELNKLYELFQQRNPRFQGGVSVCGHSLGSLILFDILCHQKRSFQETNPDEPREGKVVTRTASYVMGPAGTGQPCVTYPQLNFDPDSFFAMGSPIGMFVTVRGIDCLGLDFKLPTCPGFYNIFHPYDPVAYRIEVLINPDLANKRPVLIPHHKGRKRMHLELRDTVARLGADFKQKVVDSVRNTWNVVYQATVGGGQDIQQEVDRALGGSRSRLESESGIIGAEEEDQDEHSSGAANQGRRVDYVLQEAPLESLNEYLSAIVGHVCYWDSEDTMLFILKDIYGNLGISVDSPAMIAALAAEEQSSTVTTPSPPSPSSFVPPPRYTDPTAPMSNTTPFVPPPMSGFVRK